VFVIKLWLRLSTHLICHLFYEEKGVLYINHLSFLKGKAKIDRSLVMRMGVVEECDLIITTEDSTST